MIRKILILFFLCCGLQGNNLLCLCVWDELYHAPTANKCEFDVTRVPPLLEKTIDDVSEYYVNLREHTEYLDVYDYQVINYLDIALPKFLKFNNLVDKYNEVIRRLTTDPWEMVDGESIGFGNYFVCRKKIYFKRPTYSTNDVLYYEDSLIYSLALQFGFTDPYNRPDVFCKKGLDLFAYGATRKDDFSFDLTRDDDDDDYIYLLVRIQVWHRFMNVFKLNIPGLET